MLICLVVIDFGEGVGRSYGWVLGLLKRRRNARIEK